LSRLSNPLNITLLSSQILENEKLFLHPLPLSKSRQVFTIFYTAALRFREDGKSPAHEHLRSNLSEGEWIKAVVQGANEKSPRWRHCLMIGGLLLGSSSPEFDPLPNTLHQKLESALVHASNLALATQNDISSLSCVLFTLNHTFHMLSEANQARLNYDLLLPTITEAILFSAEGLEHGYWLGAIDKDVRSGQAQQFGWSAKSSSFGRVQEIKSRPLVTSLGTIARLWAHSIEHISDRRVIIESASRLADFTKNMAISWRQNKLSEIDTREEAQYLDQETVTVSLPLLLHLLRGVMFATIIALRATLGRLLCDPFLASDLNSPLLAARSLHILRDLFFISHRFGQTSSSQYIFVFFTAIDILNQYADHAEAFLASVMPPKSNRLPPHPLDRTLDLFFFNTAEHLTLTVSATTNANLLEAAFVYIYAESDHRLVELYEAAHSVVLAVFAAPQNADVIPRHVPVYLEKLLESFPRHLNPRQFRLAIKSIIRLAAPPSAIATVMPLMQAAVLDLLSNKFSLSSEALLPPSADIPVENQQPLSEKSVLLLATIDCLSYLPLSLLREWLPFTTDLLHQINAPIQRKMCQQRLWEVLSNGDMDVERAAACVNWWTSRGGRELLLYGELAEEEDFNMSGSLHHETKL
jgi:hypothetical protein